jgi:hypothetical protein
VLGLTAKKDSKEDSKEDSKDKRTNPGLSAVGSAVLTYKHGRNNKTNNDSGPLSSKRPHTA